MEFEWDEAKSRSNALKHLITFEEASRVFLQPCVTIVDNRFDYGEERLISIGEIALTAGKATIVVVHTLRGGRIRIISARKAHTRERAYYEHTVRRSSS